MILRRISYFYKGQILENIKTIFGSQNDATHQIRKFENAYKEKFDYEHCVATSFGLHALDIILNFYKFRDNEDIILIPSYTTIVIQQLLEERNINYRVVDILPNRATIDPKDLEKKICKQTKAVLLTHLFGNVCENETFEICHKNNLLIIEDCAHAHGAKFSDNTFVGSKSHAAFFSFDYAKIMNTFKGGMLITSDTSLVKFAHEQILKCPKRSKKELVISLFSLYIEFIASLIPFAKILFKKQSFIKNLKYKLGHIMSSRNQAITDFYQFSKVQALIGLRHLKELDKILEYRAYIANEYRKKLPTKYFLERRKGDVYYHVIYLHSQSEPLRQHCLKSSIDVGTGNTIMQEIRSPETKEISKGAKYALENYIQLPCHHKLSSSQLDKVHKTLKEFSVR